MNKKEIEQQGLRDLAERMNRLEEKNLQRREAKKWRPFELPLKLHDALGRLAVHELTAIGRNWGLRNLHLLKKQEIVETLEGHLTEGLPPIFDEFESAIIRYLEKIVSSPNHAMIQDDVFYPEVMGECGILFRGSVDGVRSVAIPLEVVRTYETWKASKPINQLPPEQQEWIPLARGMLYYYGALTRKELAGLLTRYTGKSVTIDAMVKAFKLVEEDELMIRYPGGYCFDIDFDPEEVKDEHRLRAKVDFYPFTKEQLLEAGDPDFTERSEAFDKMVQTLQSVGGLDDWGAESVVNILSYKALSGTSHSELAEILMKEAEVPNERDFRRLMDQLIYFYNHSRQWALKGYSPVGLRQAMNAGPINAPRTEPKGPADVIDFATRQKVGRNDPCPCGSGQKYKKCCGG